MLSTMNWLPVRFCPLGGLWSESPVSSLSPSPANQDCPLLGQNNPVQMWHKEVVQADRNKLTIKLSHFKCASSGGEADEATNWLTDGRVLFHRHHFLSRI